jgi:DNA-binding NtrC family response regulator
MVRRGAVRVFEFHKQVPNMSDSERGVVPLRQSARGRAALKQKGEYLVFQCLIVSAATERQEMLARAAAEAGWETAVAGDAEAALAHQRRNFMQLAFVDLESDDSGRLHELLEQIAAAKGLLTVACGTEGDLEEEIWVRQVGVWLYLPGIDDDTQLSLLCDEARRIVERLHASAKPAVSQGYRKVR